MLVNLYGPFKWEFLIIVLKKKKEGKENKKKKQHIYGYLMYCPLNYTFKCNPFNVDISMYGQFLTMMSLPFASDTD
jgi:hypothetical protein